MAEREEWNTRVGLVLAMAGNAVGLGNFLRFPAQAAQNGGGAFLIPYLISFLLMGIPLLWVEWALGRYGGRFGRHSSPGMMDSLSRRRWLKYAGVLGLLIQVGVASYYCYIESWTLGYVWHSLAGSFHHADAAEFFPAYVGADGASLVAFPGQAFVFFVLTLALNVFILSRGLARGIEIVAKVCMPLLLLFAAILAVRGLVLAPGGDPGVIESPLVGLNFVWEPRLSGLTDPTTWLAAAGQVFFTLSVGVGSVACYASYVGRDQDIALNGAAAGWMNEFVEVVLGSTIIIPIATAYLGLATVQASTSAGSGFELGFRTLPSLFGNWGWFAPVAGVLWFGLLFLAGVTSSLAMGQPVLAFLEDELGLTRQRAALLFGLIIFSLGTVCVVLFPGGAFAEFDFWTGTVGLVAFGLLEAFAFAWILGIDDGWEELNRGADLAVPRIFRWIMKYVTPFFILLVFLAALVKPAGDWRAAAGGLLAGEGWQFAPDSVVGKVLHSGEADYRWIDEGGRATPALVEDATRVLLTLVFVSWSLVVWKVWRRRSRRGR